MERVYSCENIVNAQHIKNVLLNSNIECLIKNESVQGAIGEVPPIAAWPEVWVIDSNDLDRAKKIIASFDDDSQQAEWQCQNCKENNEGTFKICWNCSHAKLDAN